MPEEDALLLKDLHMKTSGSNQKKRCSIISQNMLSFVFKPAYVWIMIYLVLV